VTSSINATVGQPLGFDATFTSDPSNRITAYTWDFGDGTPTGTGVLLSHIYRNTGAYTATLSVTNIDNLTASTNASVVVVDAANGAATPLLLYTARFNTKKSNADSIELISQLNPGIDVFNTTPLGFTVGGNSFSGTTGTAAQAFASKNQVKWTAKAVRNAPGVLQFRATVHHASLLGFPSTSGKFTLPVKLSVGTKVFSAPVTNTFRFGLSGGIAGGK
jgi:hypothetical protein